MEESMKFKMELGIKELKQLQQFTHLNKALNREGFVQIALVYQKAIERLLEQNNKQEVVKWK